MQETYVKSSFVKPPVEIKPSPIHRYGIFATRDVFPEEVIEECPVIIARKAILKEVEVSVNNRAFMWDDKSVAIALGFGSIYNHSDSPNAEVDFDYKDRIIKFIASKPINAGEEVFIDYSEDRWFVHTKRIPAIQEVATDDEGKVVRFVFTEPIRVGEECFVNYNNQDAIFVRDLSGIETIAGEKPRNFSVTKLFVLFFSLLILSMLFPLHL